MRFMHSCVSVSLCSLSARGEKENNEEILVSENIVDLCCHFLFLTFSFMEI